MKFKVIIVFLFLNTSSLLFAWDNHHSLTSYALKEMLWLKDFDATPVTSFETFLSKAFSKNFTQKDFLKQCQLNSTFKIDIPKSYKVGQKISALSILSYHSDEPDWGMDQDLNISPDQKYMGGTKGPTSKAFRHLYFKKWSFKAPWRTFHFPPREMGEALKRAQFFYDLAQTAYEVKEPYWTFRFLAWSLHYIQDLSQPFHSGQLLTPKFIAWDHIFNFEKAVSRTTQIISNYHFIYEAYVSYLIQKGDKLFIEALEKNDFMTSSSAFLIAKHSADTSNRLSYAIGESSFTFFGKKFLDPAIDVPNSPEGRFPMSEYDNSSKLSSSEKQTFLKNTAKSLKKTAFFTRSLLQLAKEEFLDSAILNKTKLKP